LILLQSSLHIQSIEHYALNQIQQFVVMICLGVSTQAV